MSKIINVRNMLRVFKNHNNTIHILYCTYEGNNDELYKINSRYVTRRGNKDTSRIIKNALMSDTLIKLHNITLEELL